MALPSRVLLLALAASLVASPALAQPELGIVNPEGATPTRLHFHLVSEVQGFPINTQPVPPDHAVPDFGGLATHTLGCVPAGTPADGMTQHQYATYYGYASANLVEYNSTDGGQPRTHPERGLLDDVRLDPAAPLVLDWYVTTFTVLPGGVPGVPTPHADPVLPNVVARATLRSGEGISIDDEAYNSGPILARGQTEPTTLAGAQTYTGMPGTPNPQVTADDRGAGKGYVYGFHIPLTASSATLPKAAGFNLRIDLFMSLPTCDMAAQDAYVMPNAVRAHSDPAHRPGLSLAVLNPLRIQYVHPQFLGDDLAIHISGLSPWGGYDVARAMRVNVTGPDGPAQGIFRAAEPRLYNEHSYTLRPVDVTFVWPFRQQGAREGTYSVEVEVENLQGTARATARAQFELGKDLWVTHCGQVDLEAAPATSCARVLQDENGRVLDPSQRSPAPQALLALAVLGVAAALRRRR